MIECACCGEFEDLIYCPSCEVWFCRDCSDWTSTHGCDCTIIQQRHSEIGNVIEKYENQITVLTDCE